MIEIMKIEEINDVMDLWKKSVQEQYEDSVCSKFLDRANDVREIYETSNIYVFTHNVKIVGYVSVVEGAYLENIYVNEDLRRQGYGTQLIKYIQSRYDELIVDVINTNKGALMFLDFNKFVKEETSLNEYFGFEETTFYWEK